MPSVEWQTKKFWFCTNLEKYSKTRNRAWLRARKTKYRQGHKDQTHFTASFTFDVDWITIK